MCIGCRFLSCKMTKERGNKMINKELFNQSIEIYRHMADEKSRYIFEERLLYLMTRDVRHIKNIIISNPYYLCRMNEDILKLISYLKKIGINNVNLLFDSNPFFLNYDRFEIEEYVNNKLDIGMELEDIIDSIEDNPYIIDED